jgi:hypothetical protein
MKIKKTARAPALCMAFLLFDSFVLLDQPILNDSKCVANGTVVL